MLEVIKHGVLLGKTNLSFENEGVLNPAAIMNNGLIHLFYRAVSIGNHSSIGYCQLHDPLKIFFRSDKAVLFPQFEYESQGIEDPRIVKIDDIFYLSYTAFDGINALGALATSKDLVNFEKQGIIVPQITYEKFKELTNSKVKNDENAIWYDEHQRALGDTKELLWDKNLIFFPRRINGEICFLHRIKPNIQILVGVKDLKELTKDFWEKYFENIDDFIVLSPKYPHEKSYVGGGCPPIETAEGWIMIYHGVQTSDKGFVYSACAALLDLENPKKEIARLPYPLFKPEREWELKGEVNNVCFPTGTAVIDDNLYIYYGAADERIACASVSISKLIAEILSNKE
ncbi:pesticidal protein Cry7Aa [Lacihabitans sp. LS3-19]|nr:pesticidal protein Cry7Aa [Lacihabitans sp. LS3-19]